MPLLILPNLLAYALDPGPAAQGGKGCAIIYEVMDNRLSRAERL
jgi:hypothetical protein